MPKQSKEQRLEIARAYAKIHYQQNKKNILARLKENVMLPKRFNIFKIFMYIKYAKIL